MSTLRLSTIQDTSGFNPSTPEQIQQGRAKAWVNFNGTLAAASMIRDSFNVSSMTDHGTGDYTINFTTAMSSVDYGVIFGWNSNSVTAIPYFVAIKGTGTAHTSKTTSLVRIIYAGTGGISTDGFEITASVFGD